MCCCGKPTVNGEPNAYSWDGKHFYTLQPTPPALEDGDELIYDEPGRCTDGRLNNPSAKRGGLDGHCHHFRFVKDRFGAYVILARNGLGDQRIRLGCVGRLTIQAGVMNKFNSDERYWLLYTLYSIHRDAADKSREDTNATWQRAAAEKRIKTRKQRGKGAVKVWIESSPITTN